MAESSRRNRIIVILIVLLLLALLLVRCTRKQPVVPVPPVTSAAVVAPAASPSPPAPGGKEPDEILTAATLQFSPQVNAGASLAVRWTGPNNARDYITIVRADALEGAYANYRDTREGNSVDLLAPIETGEWEVRYMTARSKKILGRGKLTVTSNEVTFKAPAEVVAGTSLQVVWTGPNNAGDYLTLVPKSLPDGQYGNYTYTTKGSPLALTAPIVAGESELRYMSGQGAKVLGRFPIRVVAAAITLDAPVSASAGSKVTVKWTGPNNPGDYITLVPQSLPDGQYAGYANTDSGAALTIAAPKAGLGEIRYMSGQGAKVLARRPILLTP